MLTPNYGNRPWESITLHNSIAIPSKVHGYSLAIEYMRNWFIRQFDDDYFKTVYINGKHIFDDYRRFNKTKLIKIEKPAVAITPEVEYDYNRDTIDLRYGGLGIYYSRTRYFQDPIIQDYDNNYFLRMRLEALKMNFTFRVRVSSKAQQIDRSNWMKYAFRVGSTQKEFVDYDFHLPYEAMLNMAYHAGYEIIYPDNDKIFQPKIKNVAGFLHYMNSHSLYPITYKLRTVNGNSEFFIRTSQLTHIDNTQSLSLDTGERESQLDNNFHIDMNCILTIPVPQEYIYYSSKELEKTLKDRETTVGLYSFKQLSPPEKDEHGWREYISTEYVDDDKYIESIDLTELIDGSDLQKVIDYTIKTLVSPSIFVNIKIYNAQREKNIKIDWEKLLIIPENPKFKDEYSQISVYVDLEYLNNTMIIIDDIYKGRLEPHGNDSIVKDLDPVIDLPEEESSN